MLGSHGRDTITAKETPEAFAERIIRQRDDVGRSRRYSEKVATRIEAYEKRYGMKSQDVAGAVKRGSLPETHEVCSWMMDYDLITRSGRS